MIKFDSNLKGLNCLMIDHQEIYLSDKDVEKLLRDLKRTGYI